jgi:hypothetical protein
MTKQKAMQLVRFITDDDGDAVKNDSWHWIDDGNKQGNAKFCTMEFFGFGESALEYETGEGTITCVECVNKLKLYKTAAQRAGL